MLEIKNLSFVTADINHPFEDFVIDNISFELNNGYMTCLLGRNGAGKTTLMRLIYGLLKKKSGDVIWKNESIFGKNYAHNLEFRRKVAYVGDEEFFMEKLTMDENVSLLSCLYENTETPFSYELYEEYLKALRLKKADSEKCYRELSTGQRMKFKLAYTLARQPELVLLDEPLANLDPVAKTDITELLHQRVTADNMGVFMSTHLVDEISDMTDYILLMDNGRLVTYGDREQVLTENGSGSLREYILKNNVYDGEVKNHEYKN